VLESDVTRINANTVALNKREIHLDEKGFVRLNFYKPSQYKTISFLAVATGKIPPQEFKNKIVILGITEVGAGDVASTPIGRIAGPLLHYTFLSNYLQDHLIEELPTITRALIIFAALVPFALLLLFKNITRRIIVGFAFYILLFGLTCYLFIENSLYIDTFYPLLALIVAFIAVESLAFSEQEKQEKFLKGAFSSYLSAELLEKLIKNPSALTLGGESKELTILFSDIRGFTTISESMSPPTLIKLLNRYFTPMTEAVLANGGMLDKYIGDAVMAFFNAPVDLKHHADAACKSALEMLERLHLLNQALKLEGIAPIFIGIGINSAEVVVGNMGSDNRFNYTVIGDGVNLASRVESLTKYYGATIIVTEFTIASLHDSFVYRELERVKVKGKESGVLLYELLNSSAIKQKNIYDEALVNYKNGDTQNAKELFETLLKEYEDGVANYFLNLIKDEIPWQERVMSEK
jgi:adenylate cyclase